jgi:hypothetical protein
LYKEEPVKIDGYTATYTSNTVKFGCTEILKSTIVDLMHVDELANLKLSVNGHEITGKILDKILDNWPE